MESVIVDFFQHFGRYLVVLYKICVALMVGGLFAIRFFAKPALYQIKIPRERYGKSLEMLKRFMIAAWILLVTIVISGYCVATGLEFSKGNPTVNIMVHVVEIFWIFMMSNFVYIYFKYKEAKAFLEEKEYLQVHENLELVFSYIFPLNVVLGLIAIYFNTILGGF